MKITLLYGIMCIGVWFFSFIGRCSRFPAFSPVRPLLLRLFFWSMPLISCFFSSSSASSPGFLLANAPDFLLFLRFVRSFSGFPSGQCPWFPAFFLVRPLFLRVFFQPMPLISYFFSGSSASPPAFLLANAPDFLLFLWFVRFSEPHMDKVICFSAVLNGKCQADIRNPLCYLLITE